MRPALILLVVGLLTTSCHEPNADSKREAVIALRLPQTILLTEDLYPINMWCVARAGGRITKQQLAQSNDAVVRVVYEPPENSRDRNICPTGSRLTIHKNYFDWLKRKHDLGAT